MSILLASTAYIERSANLPSATAFTMAGWIYMPASFVGGSTIFEFGNSGQVGNLYYSSGSSSLRVINNNGSGSGMAVTPGTSTWAYCFMRSNGTNLEGGWKSIADTTFPANQKDTVGAFTYGGDAMRVGVGVFFTDGMAARAHRLSVWGEYVSDANLLLAAATDLGYTTNINTHLPLTNGIGSPYADTSGNARDWTASGTITNAADPSLGGGSTVKPWGYYAQL